VVQGVAPGAVQAAAERLAEALRAVAPARLEALAEAPH
jgi:hypothetical protein